MNYFKQLPDKCWYITATHKGIYPENLAQVHREQNGFDINHFLDYPNEHFSERCRISDISQGT